ncbi:MAG TPA: hypothetical protein VGB33_02490 [Acidimicrobiia bacterium]
MTHVSTPNTGAFPKSGSTWNIRAMAGAIALTVAAGAAIATGVFISQQDESASAAGSAATSFSGERMERLLADKAALEQSDGASSSLLEDWVRYGYVPEKALHPASGGFAESPGQPR